MKNVPSVSDYKVLVTDIVNLYETARKALTEAYWQIGRRIVEGEQNGATRAKYGDRLIPRLSEDLVAKYGSGFSERDLLRTRKFYLAYPTLPTSPKLTWSQYLETLRVDDNELRTRLEQRVADEGLTIREIREVVRRQVGNAPPDDLSLTGSSPAIARTPARRLRRPANMKFRTYRAADTRIAVPKGHIRIDCGFSVYMTVPKSTGGYDLVTRPSYTYPARIERVIDGDTVWAMIYVGFQILLRRKLRLHGLDAPEADTAPGKAATKYVAGLLPPDAALVIRSYKMDTYGRYLADIFCPEQPVTEPSPETFEEIIANGLFLNQDLLTKGYAVRTPL